MKAGRKLSRRSFMARVAGGAVLAGGALVAMSGPAQAQVTDADTGPNADGASRGRGGPGNRIQGCTDGDTGSNADPAGAGRGNRRSDSDSGRNADPANCSRRR